MQVQALPGRHTASKGEAFYATGIVVLIALFVLVAYTFLHEAGHGILGLLFGATITEFDLNFLNLSAHVGVEGSFTTFQNCAVALAGAGLGLLAWATFVSVAPRNSNMVVEILKLIASLAVLNTLLVWMVIPVLYMNGGRPGDDSVNFLNYSGAPPLIVTGVALLIYICGWAFYLSRIGGIPGLRDLVSRFRFQTGQFFAPAATRSLVVLVLSGSLVAAASWGFDAYLSATNPLGLPAGYTRVAMLNLSERNYTDETIYRVTLERPATAGFYIVLQDIPSGPLDITLSGPNGYHNTFIKFGASSGGQQAIGRGKVNPEGLALEKGEYTLQITAPRGAGIIAVSTKIEGGQANVNSR